MRILIFREHYIPRAKNIKNANQLNIILSYKREKQLRPNSEK